LLLARVVKCDGKNVIVGAILTCAHSADEFAQVMSFLRQTCQKRGGNPDDHFALLKPAMPHLVNHWVQQTQGLSDFKYPVVLLAGEEWDPGFSVYIIGADRPENQVLDACEKLESIGENVWALPSPEAMNKSPKGTSRRPIGWVILSDHSIQLWTGGRESMKRLRTIIKKAAFTSLHHYQTRYGMDGVLPVFLATSAASIARD